jgi:hypothetical protein
LDPKFAMAWLGQARASYARLGMAEARAPLEQAQALRHRMPPREALYLDGWTAELEAPEAALDRWGVMARLYPDSIPANLNTAVRYMKTGYWRESLPYAERGTMPQSESIGFAFDLMGRDLMALGDLTKARSSFDRAVAAGFVDSRERQVEVALLTDRRGVASRLLASLPTSEPDKFVEEALLAVDQGRYADAQSAMIGALERAEPYPRYALSLRFSRAALDSLAGNVAAARSQNDAVRNGALAALEDRRETADSDEVVGIALSSALLGLQWHETAQAERVLSAVAANPHAQTPRLKELATVVQAEILRVGNRPEQAVRMLSPLATGDESYQARRVLMEAHADAGNLAAAVDDARWLQQRSGLAYAETIGYHCRQLWNAGTSTLTWLRGAELLVKMDRDVEARKMLSGFDQRWPPGRLPDYLRERRAVVVAASKAGGV